MAVKTTKQVAKTLKKVYATETFQKIKDLSVDITPVAEELKAHWSYDLFSRKPGPAVTDDGRQVGTDLDMACFLSALADRGAVINIPAYKSRTASGLKDDEVVISKSNRHGKLIKLVSNKETWAFSIQVLDLNVVTTDGDEQTAGAPRNFMIVDEHGRWREWANLEFVPTAKENDFLKDNSLFVTKDGRSRIDFSNFVHPNRWVSFFGQYYFLTKMLIERMEAETSHWRALLKAKRASKEAIAKAAEAKAGTVDKSLICRVSGGTRQELVKSLEATVMFGDFVGDYPKLRAEAKIEARLNALTELLTPLRFAVRTVEFAFFLHGRGKLPAWINAQWEHNFRLPKGRIEWNRLVLGQEVVGELGHALLYRLVDRKVQVKV